VNHFADGFGLQEVDAAVEECAAGEFSGFGEPASTLEQRLQQVTHHNRAAVAGKLDHILHGEGGGRAEEESDDFVNHSPAV